jgi:hypothetical protein
MFDDFGEGESLPGQIAEFFLGLALGVVVAIAVALAGIIDLFSGDKEE